MGMAMIPSKVAYVCLRAKTYTEAPIEYYFGTSPAVLGLDL